MMYVLIERLKDSSDAWEIREPFEDHDLALRQLSEWQKLLPDHQWEMHPMDTHLYEAFHSLMVRYASDLR